MESSSLRPQESIDGSQMSICSGGWTLSIIISFAGWLVSNDYFQLWLVDRNEFGHLTLDVVYLCTAIAVVTRISNRLASAVRFDLMKHWFQRLLIGRLVVVVSN